MVSPRTERSEPRDPYKVNLNLASRNELMQIEGLKPETVDRIVRYREAYGRFRHVDELDNISEFDGEQARGIKHRVYV